MRRWLLAAALAVALPTFALAEVHEVQVGNYFFSPQNLTIRVGDTVRWIWVEGTHTTTSGDPEDPETTGDVWSGPLNGSSTMYEFTFNDTGTFPYFCSIHPSLMKATVVVQTETPVQPTTWTSIKRLFEDTSPLRKF